MNSKSLKLMILILATLGLAAMAGCSDDDNPTALVGGKGEVI